MKTVVSTKLNETTYQFHIDEKDEKSALHLAAVFGNPPQMCDECTNKEAFKLDSNKDSEGNIYINVLCRKCGAKAKLGSYKTGGFFWHKFEKYVPANGSSTPKTTVETPPAINDEDLPF